MHVNAQEDWICLGFEFSGQYEQRWVGLRKQRWAGQHEQGSVLDSMNKVELANMNLTRLSWPTWTMNNVMLASMNEVELASMDEVKLLTLNNVDQWTTLHEQWTTLSKMFSHHCCNNLLTSWNNHVNNSELMVVSNTNFPVSNSHEQPCYFIIAHQYCWNNAEQNFGPTMLLTQANNVVQALFRQQSCDNLWDYVYK